MKQKERQEEKKEDTSGVVTLPNIPGIMPQFTKVAKQHGFRVANNTDRRVRDLVSKAKTPLGDKKSCIVYNIPCKCGQYSYIGETDRKFATRRKEHQDKVRLTKEDISNDRMEMAEARMNQTDGGLAKHSTLCNQGCLLYTSPSPRD